VVASAAATSPAIAAPLDAPDSDKVAQLDRALESLWDMGLTLPERAVALGFEPNAPYLSSTVPGLRSVLHKFALEYGSADVWSRIRSIERIKRGLEDRFGDDSSTKLKFVNDPNLIPGRSLRQMMTKSYDSLEFAGIQVNPRNV
jgi:hypothetical protein